MEKEYDFKEHRLELIQQVIDLQGLTRLILDSCKLDPASVTAAMLSQITSTIKQCDKLLTDGEQLQKANQAIADMAQEQDVEYEGDGDHTYPFSKRGEDGLLDLTLPDRQGMTS